MRTALEETRAVRSDESAALLAHHWEEASRPREAALWQRRAAEWIRGRDSVAATHHWQRARSLASGLEGEEMERLALQACAAIAMMGGWRLGLSPVEMAEIGAQGRVLAQRFDDRSALVTIITAEAARRGVGGDTRAYYDGALEAERLFDDSVYLAARLTAQLNRGYSTYCMGRMSEALPQIEKLGVLVGSDLRAGFDAFGFSAADMVHARRRRNLGARRSSRREPAGPRGRTGCRPGTAAAVAVASKRLQKIERLTGFCGPDPEGRNLKD